MEFYGICTGDEFPTRENFTLTNLVLKIFTRLFSLFPFSFFLFLFKRVAKDIDRGAKMRKFQEYLLHVDRKL